MSLTHGGEGVDEPLPVDFGPLLAGRRCWYCGTTDAAVYEREHQLPISRGGVAGGATVDSCQFHNRLKGDRTIEEFRAALAERLDVEPSEVVFAGEASWGRPATDLSQVRSLVDDRDGVRLYPDVGQALRRAQLILRGRGLPRTTLTGLASRYVAEGIARDAELFRADQLFELEEDGWELPSAIPEPPTPLEPGKVPVRRRVIRIDGQVHEALVAAVLFRRTIDRPHMALVDAVDEAVGDWIVRVEDDFNEGRPLPPISHYDEDDLLQLRVDPRRSDP